jgi:two-component system OmpR family response regulator
MHHILLAIDDAMLRTWASDYLSHQGYLTFAARGTTECVLQEESADCLIIETEGGGEDVPRMCSAIRDVSMIPIIVLSSRDDSEERLRALEAGADDYLVTPFNPRELTARIRVVSRQTALRPSRGFEPEPRGYRFGEWRLDMLSHTLQHSDGSVQMLTMSEFRLLEALVKSERELLPRAHLLRILHGSAWRDYPRGIEVRMSRMRRLLRANRSARSGTLIRSIRGEGYVFEGTVVPD